MQGENVQSSWLSFLQRSVFDATVCAAEGNLAGKRQHP